MDKIKGPSSKIVKFEKRCKEGQSADVIADGLFRLSIDARLRRRVETQITSMVMLMDSLLDKIGQHFLQGTIIITADRVYGHPSIIETISGKVFSSFFMLPINFCHFIHFYRITLEAWMERCFRMKRLRIKSC